MSKTHSAKNITTVLQSPKSQLVNIINRANELATLNQCFADLLDHQLVKHCQITNLDNGVLTIMVDNSSWGTRIRYSASDIIKNLHKSPKFRQIASIRCIIRPKHNVTKAKQKQRTLSISPDNIELIQSVADNVCNAELKETLKKFGSRNKSTLQS